MTTQAEIARIAALPVVDRIVEKNKLFWELLQHATTDARKREIVDVLFPGDPTAETCGGQLLPIVPTRPTFRRLTTVAGFERARDFCLADAAWSTRVADIGVHPSHSHLAGQPLVDPYLNNYRESAAHQLRSAQAWQDRIDRAKARQVKV